MFDWLKKIFGAGTTVEEEPVINDPNVTTPVVIKPAPKKAYKKYQESNYKKEGKVMVKKEHYT